jgi:hypothetical protein
VRQIVKVAEAIVGFINSFEMEQKDNKIENIPFFKYFDHKNHFIKDY